MRIDGLNHLTLSVASLPVSLHFYGDTLGMQLEAQWKHGAYLSAGTLWLCLTHRVPAIGDDYSHIAFGIEPGTLPAWRERIERAGVRYWKTNHSEGDSLYILDPDGHRLELGTGSLQSRLASLRASPYEGLRWPGDR